MAIPLYESILYPNAPAERLGPGVARMHTRGGLLNPLTLEINEARVAEVLAELREGDTHLCVDIETVQNHPGEYWVAHDQSRVDELLSALAALRAYIQSERPGTLVGSYAWFWTGWRPYIPDLAAEPFRREHLVSRLAMYGESEVTDWADFLVVDLYPQFALADSPTYWRPFIQGHLADIRDALPGMEVVAFYHNTLAGRALETGHMAWLLAEAESAGYDGACVWVPDGSHVLTKRHITYRDWTVPAVTTDPEAWSAAGEVTLRVRLRWTWYDVTVDLAGTKSMDHAAAILEAAINAAIDARTYGGTPNPANPGSWIREHPGTVSVAWNGTAMVCNVSVGGGDAGPPHWTEILTRMEFAAPVSEEAAAVSSLLHLASVGHSYDLIDVDPWTGGWVFSGGEPVDWVRELIEAAAETGGGGEETVSTITGRHENFQSLGGVWVWINPGEASDLDGLPAVCELDPGAESDVLRGTAAVVWDEPIPADAELLGVTVSMHAASRDVGEGVAAMTASVQLYNGTSPVSEPREVSMPAGSLALVEVGGAADAWGVELTKALLDNLRIGTVVSNTDDAVYGEAAIDGLEVTLHLNYAPEVAITSPTDGGTIYVDEEATLTATATDVEDGDLSDSIEWSWRPAVSADPFAIIGTGASVGWTPPGAGQYEVRAAATDSGGLTGSHIVTVTVGERAAGGGGFRARVDRINNPRGLLR